MVHRRSLQYLGLLMLLVVLGMIVPHTGLRSGPLFHTAAETLAANLALLVGLVAALHYSGTKKSLYVFVAVAFLGTALLDGLQVVVDLSVFGKGPPGPWEAPDSAARLFLPLWLWLGAWTSSREQRWARLGPSAPAAVALGAAGVTLLCVLWIFSATLSKAVPPGGTAIHVACSVLFFAAAATLLRKRGWPYDIFEHCLMLSLIAAFMGNTVFLAGSRETYDALFTAAQHLKNLTYLLALAGLVLSMQQLLRQAEQDSRELAGSNEALRQETGEHRRVRGELQELTHTLEQRVEARTRELAESQAAAERARREAVGAQQQAERARQIEESANRQLRSEIAEREQAEQALRESESYLRLALSVGQTGIWSWDLREDAVVWDERVYSIFGRARESFTTSFENALGCVHPEDVEGLKQKLDHIRQQGGDLDTDLRLVRPDGSVRHVISRAMTIPDAEGKPRRMIGSLMDLTERQRGEEALRQRTAELSQMVKALSCLYGIAHLLDRPEMPLEQICRRTLELLPLSWHDPENTCARLTVGGGEYRSSGWRETEFRQAAGIVVGGERIGSLEIGFFNAEPEQEYFRREEIKVIEALVVSLGRIIEHKRASESLRRSEQRYRSLFDGMISGCALHEVIVDETGKPIDYRFLEVNAAFEKLTGLRANEIVGKTVREVLPGIEPEWIDTFGGVALSGKPARLERYNKLLGRFLEVAAFSPEKGRFATIFNDITERRSAEEQLASERNLLRTLIDSLPDSIYTKDAAGRYLANNTANRKVLGVADESQSRGKTVFDFFPAEHARLYAADDQAVLRSGQPVFEREEPYRDQQGNVRLYSTTKIPLCDAAGHVTGLLGVSRDITERKQDEQALRDSEERFRQLAENIDQVFWLFDLDCRELLYVSRAYETIARQSRQSLYERPRSWLELVAEEDRQRVEEAIRSLPEQGTIELEYRIVRADGTLCWIRDRRYLVTRENGEPYRQAGIVVDITQRKQVAEALEQQAKELAASNAELEQFAYAASHDLQEPLRMIAGYSQLLARRFQGKLGSDADEFIRFILEAVDRMQGLIRDLLAYSRAGRSPHPPEPVDLQDCVRSSLANLRAALEENSATVEVDALPQIPGQRSQLVQLFQNLIGNAVKYHGDEPPRVRVSAECKGDDWEFAVRDNGIGIEPQFHEQVFEVFRRLHGRREYSGTGIGLAICKKIVESHGGRIWVESEIGRGATFRFSLPCANGSSQRG